MKIRKTKHGKSSGLREGGDTQGLDLSQISFPEDPSYRSYQEAGIHPWAMEWQFFIKRS